jgi:transcription initiation factor TFIIB
MSTQVFGNGLYKPFHKEEGRSCRLGGGRVSGLWGPVVTDLQRGEVVCAQCGLVVAESAVDTGPEWRVVNEREQRQVRAAPLKLVVKTDMAVKPEHGVRWRRLAKLHRNTLHSRERRLVEIGAELKRIRECAGLPHSVMKEAEALVKKYFEVMGAFRLRWWP